MPSITVTEATRQRLLKLTTKSASRDSYNEVIEFLLHHLESHQSWPFVIEDIHDRFGAKRGDVRYCPEMDLNGDGVINSGDMGLAVKLGVPRRQAAPPAPSPTPAPAPKPTTLPLRQLMVVPRDYPLNAWAFGNTLVTWQQAHNEFIRWEGLFRDWLRAESLLTYDFTAAFVQSKYTLQELALRPDNELRDVLKMPPEQIKYLTDGAHHDALTGLDDITRVSALDGCAYAPISGGQGLHETQLWEKVVRGELGWKSEVEGKNYVRWNVCVIGAGGWNGGRYAGGELLKDVNHPNDDAGACITGDWGVRCMVTKVPDPCCELAYGDACKPRDSAPAAYFHEKLHHFGVSCHKGNVLPDGSVLAATTMPMDDPDPNVPTKTHLTPGQLMQLRAFNVPRWLRPA